MRRLIKFVALGNSLTVGFIPSRIATQPYSRFLKEKIDDFLKQREKKSEVEVRVVNRGVNGDLTSRMLLRFRQDVIQLKPKSVILLGGTNDIGWGFPIEKIFGNVKTMCELALENRVEPVACTLPSIIGWDEGIPPRLKFNQFLKRYCSERGILCADIFAKTCDQKTKRLKSMYSSDGLHLNTLGYQKMAESIFDETVRKLLIQEFQGY